MSFQSILFDRTPEGKKEFISEMRAFFIDLNLNQVIEALTAGKQEYKLKEYGDFYELNSYIRLKVVKYIERCHLEDGGYFFARIPPSSGLDTYFVIKSLSAMEVKPNRPEAIADFFLNDMKDVAISGMTSIFLIVEVLNELGKLTEEIKNIAEKQIMASQNIAGGFGSYQDVDIEVPSELQDTYRAVRALKDIGSDFDRERVIRFTTGFLRSDGGYGAKEYSTLASTFYATEIHKLLGVKSVKLSATRDYLKRREENWQVQFIEDVYWLVLGLANLGEKTNVPDRVTKFVMMCQRSNGGFSRATIMGIPTLEYTFYALSILREAGVL